MAGQRFVTRSIITTMPRSLTASVSPSAMAHNLAVIRRQVQENRPNGHAQADTRLWAVVKADAYGHGLANALTGFADADGMALLEFEAADWLRRHGWNKPILMLEGAFDATDVAQAAADLKEQTESGGEGAAAASDALRLLYRYATAGERA